MQGFMTKRISLEEWDLLPEGDKQNITEMFIRNHIDRCQSDLVDDLLAKGIFNYDDIKNGSMTDEEILFEWEDDIERMKSENPDMTESDCIEMVRMEEDTHHEIFEWYLVSDWFEKRLEEINEPILETDYWHCSYWGRCCTGQSIYLDRNIQELAFKHSTDERLFKVDEDKLERISRHDRTRP